MANQFLTTNQHYLAVALGYDFHPLVRGEFFTIGDIQGQGIFWSPALKINAYENLDFTIGVMGAFVFNNKHLIFPNSGRITCFTLRGVTCFSTRTDK